MPFDSLVIAGRYTVIQVIARGGMGIVYKCRQEDLDRTVAVKMILGGCHASEGFQKRFAQEARAAAQLRHPNIVLVHDWGEDSGQPFFTMEFIDGPSLHETFLQERCAPRAAAEMVRTLALAMDFAHQQGVLHRDLKPSNVVLDARGGPHITDFGLARRIDEETVLTASGDMLGTPGFLPPEQILPAHGPVGPWSDVYGLGGILYYLLTGRAPHSAPSMVDALRLALEADPISPSSLMPSVPRELSLICLKALSRDIGRRYESADELALDLGRWIEGRPILARAAPRWEKLWKSVKRRPALVAVSVALLILGIAGLLLVGSLRREVDRNASTATEKAALAEDAEAHLQLVNAEQNFRTRNVPAAVATLIRVLRKDPSHRVAASRLLSALSEKSFHLPVGAPLRHQGCVRWVEFSPNGKQVATASDDGTACLWDTETGLKIGPPFKHSKAVTRVAFSPNGRWLATASRDGTACLWDIASGSLTCPPLQHAQGVTSIGFSPDGTRFATTSSGGSVRLWSLPSGEPVGLASEQANRGQCSVFSTDGAWLAAAAGTNAFVWDTRAGHKVAGPLPHSGLIDTLAIGSRENLVLSGGRDRMIRAWEIQGGQARLAYSLMQAHAVSDIQISPDGGRFVAACQDGTAVLRSLSDGASLTYELTHGDSIDCVRWNPDGTSILTGSDDRTARLWDAHTGMAIGQPLRHGQRVACVAFHPGGNLIATASEDSTARLWHLQRAHAVPTPLSHSGRVTSAQFSPDARSVVTSADDGRVRVWDSRNGRLLWQTAAGNGAAASATFSPDGTMVAASWMAGEVRVMRVAEGGVVSTFPRVLGTRSEIEFSPDGKRLAVAGRRGEAFVHSVHTGQLLSGPMRHGAEISQIRFSPDGATLITAGSDGRIVRWNGSDGQAVTPPWQHSDSSPLDYIHSIEFSQDGSRLVSASENGSAFVWSVQEGKSVLRPLKHEKPVVCAEFDPAGHWIVTGSADGKACLWDAITGKRKSQPLMHEGTVRSAHFSLDGKRLVTSSSKQTARVWDVATGLPLSEPLWHPTGVQSAVFSEDGQRLLTRSSDHIVRIWEVPTPPGDIPSWFLDLAEALVESEPSDLRTTARDTPRSLAGVQLHFKNEAPASFYGHWAHWFLSPEEERTVSAFTTYSVQDLIQNLIDENRERSFYDAVLLSPTNVQARARLAKLISNSKSAYKRAEAEFMNLQSLRRDNSPAE